jgi:hypothetical protein
MGTGELEQQEATMMQRLHFVSIWIIITLLLLAMMALALFIVPPDAGAQDDEADLHTLVAAMEQAVLDQDRSGYLALVVLSDPVFAREHTYWVEDWMGPGAVSDFELALDDLSVADDSATGRLRITWKLRSDYMTQKASLPARFVRAEDGAWRYAGEAWTTFNYDRFQVHAAPGLEDVAESLSGLLPELYGHVTGSLDHTPENVVQIKLYASPSALTAATALSLPTIRGWNEPGESLKLYVRPGTPAANLHPVLAHELTHFLMFDLADTSHGSYPWWLAEGVAEYVASAYGDESAPAGLRGQVAGWLEADALADWNMISDFEETPRELWGMVYPQGYAFVCYVSETFGDAARNEWIRLMAVEMALDEATQAAFGMPFEELDQGFHVWLQAEPVLSAS